MTLGADQQLKEPGGRAGQFGRFVPIVNAECSGVVSQFARLKPFQARVIASMKRINPQLEFFELKRFNQVIVSP